MWSGTYFTERQTFHVDAQSESCTANPRMSSAFKPTLAWQSGGSSSSGL